MSRLAKILGLGLVLATAAPSMADVKAGMAAWARGDYAKAVKEFQAPAAAGDPDGQFNLAQAYRLGRGVKADPKQAEELYQKAAAQGHIRAQLLYAIVLQENGARKEAIPWLEKSATRGDHEAQYLLALALFKGEDVARDWVQAYGMMKASATAGQGPAKDALVAMDKVIPPDQRERGAAMALQLEATIARIKAQQEQQAARQNGLGLGALGPPNGAPPNEPDQ